MIKIGDDFSFERERTTCLSVNQEGKICYSERERLVDQKGNCLSIKKGKGCHSKGEDLSMEGKYMSILNGKDLSIKKGNACPSKMGKTCPLKG